MEPNKPTRVYFELPNELLNSSDKEIDELAGQIWLQAVKILGAK